MLGTMRKSDFTMPRVFVAGAFRADTQLNVVRNIRRAEELGVIVARMGAVPVIFHTMYQNLQGTMPGPFMDEASLSVLSTCHAAAVAMSHLSYEASEGTEGDVRFARANEIPVFFDSVPVGDVLLSEQGEPAATVLKDYRLYGRYPGAENDGQYARPLPEIFDRDGHTVRTVCDSGNDGVFGLLHWIKQWKAEHARGGAR